jgi:crotonobetainyl-CoA:carnitine CoA-transferase CaiB-like acyl-CoA transferase
VPVPGGDEVPMLAPPVDSSAWPAPSGHTVPALGADTRDVLAELGYSAEEIEKLAGR